jgi:hypothetical protein
MHPQLSRDLPALLGDFATKPEVVRWWANNWLNYQKLLYENPAYMAFAEL